MDETNVVDYEVAMEQFILFFDNTSAINISMNRIQHSRTKHIDTKHHFIMEFVENNTVTLDYVQTEKQIANIFTKSLDSVRFKKLKKISWTLLLVIEGGKGLSLFIRFSYNTL